MYITIVRAEDCKVNCEPLGCREQDRLAIGDHQGVLVPQDQEDYLVLAGSPTSLL